VSEVDESVKQGSKLVRNMSNFGLKLVNLNEVKVTLNAYEIENLFCYQSEMIETIVSYYVN
jgi:hypothetical protein